MAGFKKRTKADVKSKKPFTWGGKTKSGRTAKSGTVVEFKDGSSTTLLTPSGRAAKFAAELGMGVKITNSGEFKKKDGKELTLTREERSYRSGYLDARKDSANAYKAKKNKGAK